MVDGRLKAKRKEISLFVFMLVEQVVNKLLAGFSLKRFFALRVMSIDVFK